MIKNKQKKDLAKKPGLSKKNYTYIFLQLNKAAFTHQAIIAFIGYLYKISTGR